MKMRFWGLIKLIRFLKDSDVKITKKMIFLVPVLYLLFPFDLIGDFFPLAGQLDDIAVFVIMWPILKNMLAKYIDHDDNQQPHKIKKDKNTINIDRNDYDVK